MWWVRRAQSTEDADSLFAAVYGGRGRAGKRKAEAEVGLQGGAGAVREKARI